MSQNTVRTRAAVNWPLVVGLGAFALLWPLTELSGIADALGDGGTSVLLLVVTAAAWIGVVGAGRVPRPVLTLTLAALVHAVLTLAFVGFLDLTPQPVTASTLAFVVPVVLVRSLLLGVVAGLLAAAVQRRLARRS